MPHEVVLADRFGTGQIDRAVQRLGEGRIGHGGGDVLRRNGLHQDRWEPNRLPFGRRLGDAAHELEELRGAHDRVRNRGRLDQIFLSQLRAEVTAREQAVGADDRQRHMMADARGGFRGQEVATRGLEKRQDGVVLPRGRIRDIDDHLSAGKRLRQSLAGDGVDAR